MSVVLTVLKTISILLLVIVGLVFLLIGLVLFVPVRYSVTGSIKNKAKVHGKISWLMSLLCYQFIFENGEITGVFRIFGFRIRKKKKVTETELEEDLPGEEVSEDNSQAYEHTASDAELHMTEIESEPSEDIAEKHKYREKLWNVWKKVLALPQKLKRQSKKILAGMQNFKGFTEKVHQMLTDEINQKAVRKVWTQLRYLLKHFGFRKIHTDLTFSLSDPAWTGQALGVICMIPFFYQYDFHLYPDFESDRLYVKGEFGMKGRVRLFHMLVVLIRLVCDRAVRSFGKRVYRMMGNNR